MRSIGADVTCASFELAQGNSECSQAEIARYYRLNLNTNAC